MIFNCHAGCDPDDVVADAGLRWPDLFPPPDPAARANGHGPRVVGERRYEIRDMDGSLVAVKVRRDRPDGGKDLTWERPDGRLGLDGRRAASLPLYGVHQLGDATQVVVTEGEKARDALADHGIPAVGTVTGAAETPGDEALRPLVGLDIVLWPDNDAPGGGHMDRNAARFVVLGQPADRIRVVTWPDAPEHGDAADVVGGAEALRRLIDAALPWQPVEGENPETIASDERGIEPPAFPLDALPPLLADVVGPAARTFGLPAAYYALPAIATVAAAVGNGVELELRPGQRERLIFWLAIIGPPRLRQVAGARAGPPAPRPAATDAL